MNKIAVTQAKGDWEAGVGGAEAILFIYLFLLLILI